LKDLRQAVALRHDRFTHRNIAQLLVPISTLARVL
jgi:hypothetical protein